MDWTRSVDLYCERTGPAWDAEPLNAVTNLAFLAAAAWLWRRHGRAGADLRAVAALLALIGLCSLAFHTLATAWAGLADTLAIGVWIWFYLQRLLVRGAGWGNAVAVMAVAGWVLASRFAEAALPPGLWNGSVAYLPAALTLLAATGWIATARPAALAPFALATGTFAVSITLRSLDMALCEAWPAGTHFVWHCLNAVVLASLGAGLARLGDGVRLAGRRGPDRGAA
jgi:hypothetical protein